jgi:hypothetical protein
VGILGAHRDLTQPQSIRPTAQTQSTADLKFRPESRSIFRGDRSGPRCFGLSLRVAEGAQGNRLE